MQLLFKKLHDSAKAPSFAHDSDAGMDFYAVEKTTIEPGTRVAIKTGIALAIPKGYVGLFWDKSSVGISKGLKTLGGVIDAGYRGEVMIGILNTTNSSYTFEAGDKVSQLLVQKIEQPTMVETDMLGSTERGEGGFGSTGI